MMSFGARSGTYNAALYVVSSGVLLYQDILEAVKHQAMSSGEYLVKAKPAPDLNIPASSSTCTVRVIDR